MWSRIVHKDNKASIPPKMFCNASSTLVLSRADVSIKESLFSPANDYDLQMRLLRDDRGREHTGKRFGFLSRDSPLVTHIALVPYEHGNDVGIAMISHLFQP